MNPTCSICLLEFIEANICTTPCGHLFHRSCIVTWLNRQATCPQCKTHVNERNLIKLYINFRNSESASAELSNQTQIVEIKKLEKKIHALERSVKKSEGKNQLLKTELTREIHNLNVLLVEKQGVIDNKHEQIEALTRRMQTYQKIETLLNGTLDDMSTIISQVQDPDALHTYMVVMKRELITSIDRQRELRNKVNSLQAELNRVSNNSAALIAERDKIKHLEAELMISERKKLMLQYKIKQFEANMWTSSPSSVDTKPTGAQENVENSPYLRVKSQGVFAVREHSQKNCQKTGPELSIFARKKLSVIPPIGKSATTRKGAYDGYGGHAKYDRFPSPISGFKLKRSIDESKRDYKKAKFDSDDN